MIGYMNRVVSNMLLLVHFNLLKHFPSNIHVVTTSLIRLAMVLPECIRMYAVNMLVIDSELQSAPKAQIL